MKTISLSETIQTRLRFMAVLGFASLAMLVITACASVDKNPAVVVSKYAEDFNSGSPGAKNLWDQVVATVNSGDYATALATLEQLQANDELAPRQAQAVKEMEAAVKKKMADSGKTGTPNR